MPVLGSRLSSTPVPPCAPKMNPPLTSAGMIITPRARCSASRAAGARPVLEFRCCTTSVASSTVCCSLAAWASCGNASASAATATIRMRFIGIVPPALWLELDTCLRFDAGSERMLHELHLRDKVCDLDELGLGVAAGDDDVEVARLPFERGHHLLHRQVVVP